MDIEMIESAKFITIDRDVPDKGLWKVLDKIFIRDEDGKVLVIRMTVDKDLSKAGDEKIIEWQQEAAREITILEVFNAIAKATAESWPPPREMDIDQDGVKTHFKSLNSQGGPHNPFTGFVNRRLISHWEYQDETGQKFLQIYMDENEVVYMATGYAVNEAYVKVV